MIKKNDGFTLLEIIISIAALSLISVFILRMFIASSNLNDRARNTDIAINQSITEIEKLKSNTRLSGYLETAADVSFGEYDVITVSFYYEDDWDIIIHPAGSIPRNARFSLKMDIKPDERLPEDGSAAYGALYTVTTDVKDISLSKEGLTLTSMQTKKYFPGIGEDVI